MPKKPSTLDQDLTEVEQKQPTREEINEALARLQKIAENLPPVDAVAIVREGRDVSARSR